MAKKGSKCTRVSAKGLKILQKDIGFSVDETSLINNLLMIFYWGSYVVNIFLLL